MPGDKSISHRALILSALSVGRATVAGLLEGEDVLRTAGVLRALGVPVARGDDGVWVVDGVGVGGLAEPDDILDFGNSGTGVRLMMGVLATSPGTAYLTGDDSLRRRPMGRVAAPLIEFGARIRCHAGGGLPAMVEGAPDPLPIHYTLPVASAQVKSAILLAGLNTPGETTVVEPHATRDHTERMLTAFGGELSIRDTEAGREITVTGQPELSAPTLHVPGDPSSAAFALVAGLVVPNAEVQIANVGVNPLRIGLLTCLTEMGADLTVTERDSGGEPIADLTARSSRLTGIEVPAERAPSMIDEYPILAVAAACAKGATVMTGLGELRVKESDRLTAVAEGLAKCGVAVEVGPDWLKIEGCDGPPPGGGVVATGLDHRIAMAFLTLGAVARAPVTIDDGAMIATSFPDFVASMNQLGTDIAPPT